MQLHFYQNIYEPDFNLGTLNSEEIKRVEDHHLSDSFPVGAAIALHYLTLGFFSFIYYGLKHDELPKLRSDDPNGLMAVGLMFVPLFNLYWQFMLWVRLVKRLEFQYKLKNAPCPVNRDLAIACMICKMIPGINFVSFLVLMPILISQIQEAIDGLVNKNAYNTGYTN